jgi:DNA-binding LacI/PurR family transcriptional regulator
VARASSSSITIRDVAESAGVSVSTVSLVFNHPGKVSDRTRQRVLGVVDELGFVPKAEAVARARRGVGRIGVLGPFTSHPAAGRRLNGILRGVAGTDLEVVVFDHGSASDSTEPFLTSLPRSGRLDGLLVTSLLPGDDVVDRLLALPLPTVLVDAYHSRLSSVQTDDVAGGRLAAEHLIGLAPRSWGFFGESQRSEHYISPARRRLDGFRRVVQEAGNELAETAVLWTPREFTEACHNASRLLSALRAPAAVFASDDVLAAAVVRAAGQAGLGTPTDVAVVGFDDSDLARVLDLTTVHQPLEESGEVAVQMLLEQIRRPAAVRSTQLELRLVHRGSA